MQRTVLAALVVTLLAAPATADCVSARSALAASLDSAPVATLADMARGLEAEGCSSAVAADARRQVSSVAARRAGGLLETGDLAGAEAQLADAPVLHWEVQAARGGLAAARKDHAEAARNLNAAIDTLGDPALTPQDPALEPVVPRLMAMAQEQMMLAGSARTSMRSDGTSTGVMRALSRGIAFRAKGSGDATVAADQTATGYAAPAETGYNIVAAAAARVETVYLPVRFAFGQATLDPSGVTEAEALAAFLRGQGAVGRITLIGHTDDVGPEDVNLDLSLARAQTVRDFLRSAGVTATILVEGRGETEPPAYAAGMTYSLDEQRAIARRVELALGG